MAYIIELLIAVSYFFLVGGACWLILGAIADIISPRRSVGVTPNHRTSCTCWGFIADWANTAVGALVGRKALNESRVLPLCKICGKLDCQHTGQYQPDFTTGPLVDKPQPWWRHCPACGLHDDDCYCGAPEACLDCERPLWEGPCSCDAPIEWDISYPYTAPVDVSCEGLGYIDGDYNDEDLSDIEVYYCKDRWDVSHDDENMQLQYEVEYDEDYDLLPKCIGSRKAVKTSTDWSLIHNWNVWS